MLMVCLFVLGLQMKLQVRHFGGQLCRLLLWLWCHYHSHLPQGVGGALAGVLDHLHPGGGWQHPDIGGSHYTEAGINWTSSVTCWTSGYHQLWYQLEFNAIFPRSGKVLLTCSSPPWPQQTYSSFSSACRSRWAEVLCLSITDFRGISLAFILVRAECVRTNVVHALADVVATKVGIVLLLSFSFHLLFSQKGFA